MKLLYFTDSHVRGNAPANRKDNFIETLKAKFQEIADLANTHGVKAILHGGDFFDLPNPALTVCGEFLSILKQAHCPIYAIAGNHDLFGHNPETLPRTILGFIAKLGFIQLLEAGTPVFIEEGALKVQITGQHYHYDLDKRDPKLDYHVTKNADCNLAIHLVHGMLMDKAFIDGVAHTTIDKICDTEADLTICGHNHLGFADCLIDGKWFINPGALVRLSNHPQEMIRRPQVLLISCTPEGMKTERIILKSGLPGHEVLDRSSAELAAYQEERLSGFVQGIRASGDYKGVDISQVIETIASREGLAAEVKEEALLRIAIAQERLAQQRGMDDA